MGEREQAIKAIALNQNKINIRLESAEFPTLRSSSSSQGAESLRIRATKQS